MAGEGIRPGLLPCRRSWVRIHQPLSRPRSTGILARLATCEVQATELPVAVLLDQAHLALAILEAHRRLGLVAVDGHVGHVHVPGLLQGVAGEGEPEAKELLTALLLPAPRRRLALDP